MSSIEGRCVATLEVRAASRFEPCDIRTMCLALADPACAADAEFSQSVSWSAHVTQGKGFVMKWVIGATVVLLLGCLCCALLYAVVVRSRKKLQPAYASIGFDTGPASPDLSDG